MSPLRPRPAATVLARAALAALLGVAGCEKKSEERAFEGSSGRVASGEERSGERRPTGGTFSPPRLSLLEAGAEPRSELRYHLEPGARHRAGLDMTITVQRREGGLPSIPMTMPDLQLVLDIVVVEKLSDEEARYGFELVEARLTSTEGVDPRLVQATEPEVKKAVTMSGIAVVNRRGMVRDVEVDVPAGLDEQIYHLIQGAKHSLDQLASPLPEEPVGVGAQWEVSQVVTLGGLEVEQKTLYALSALEGRRGTLEATIHQSADRQKAAMPGLPPGTTAELLSFESKGAGQVRFDLETLVPPSARLDVETLSSLRVRKKQDERSLSTKASMSLELQLL